MIETHFTELGTALNAERSLEDQLKVYVHILLDGREVTDRESAAALAIEARAKNAGQIKAPDGTMFLVSVGERSRLSARTPGNAGAPWLPFDTDRRGLVIGNRLLAMDPTERSRWPFGTLALNIRRFGGEAEQGHVPAGVRLHVAHTVLSLMRIIDIPTAWRIADRLHPISRQQEVQQSKAA